MGDTTGWSDAKTPEGKRARQGVLLRRVASGEDPEVVRLELGIGKHTWAKWLYQHPGDGFKESFYAARTAGSHSDDGEFPSFLNFRARFFAYRNPRLDPHPLTGDAPIVRAVNSTFQVDAVQKLEAENRLIMVCPPASIKSTLLAIEYSVYLIMKDRNNRILAVGHSQPEAKKIIHSVQDRLDHDHYHFFIEMLIKQGDPPVECPVCIFGAELPFKPEGRKLDANTSWGAEGFRVVGATSGEKDLTMQSKGAGSQILGIRANHIILDDIQSPDDGYKNPQNSADLVRWFNDVILGRVFIEDKVVVLGNFFSPDDFVHKLLEEKSDIFGVVNFPAVLDWNSRKLLCPEIWSWETLMKKKAEVGDRTWHYTWMQEDASFEDATFRREVLYDARDETLSFRIVPYGVREVFLGVDPATSELGHCAMVAWGYDPQSHKRYLLDVFNKTGMRTWQNLQNQIFRMFDDYPDSRKHLIIEGNQQQKAFVDGEFTRELRRRGIKIHAAYQTASGSGARAEQENFDITTVGGLFDTGLIVLPYGGPSEEREQLDRYVDQLCAWRTDEKGHSIKHLKRDMTMATLFAESGAFEMDNKPKDKIQQFRNSHASLQWSRKKEKPDRRTFVTSP